MILAVIGVGLAALCLCAMVARRYAKRFGLLSVPVVFLMGSTLMLWLGFVVMWWQERQEWWANQALLSLSLGMAAFAIGVEIACRTSPAPRGTPGRSGWLALPIAPQAAAPATVVTYAFAGLYFVLLGYVPILTGLQQVIAGEFQPGLLNTLRTTRDFVITGVSADRVPLQGLFDMIRYFAVPMVMINLWEQTPSKKRQRRRIQILIAAGLLLLMATGQRWPLLYSGLAAGMWMSVVSPGARRISARSKLMMAIATAALVVGVSGLLGRSAARGSGIIAILWAGLGEFVGRLLFGGMVVPFLSYRTYAGAARLWGESWLLNLTTYLPTVGESFPVVFYREVTGDPVGYTASPDYFTEAFLNAGWIGVVLLSAVWGMALVKIDWWMRKARTGERPVRVVIAAVAALSFSTGVAFILGAVVAGVFVSAIASVLGVIRFRPTGSLGAQTT